jgi:translation initiation factor IF-3
MGAIPITSTILYLMAIRKKFQKKNDNLSAVKKFRLNRFIRVPEVRLIDDEGNNLGIIKIQDALRLAEEKELDLIEVSPKAQPPVAKIMDYGKYKYELDKQEKRNRAQIKKTETKGIRLTFRIKGGDLETRLKQAVGFLTDGHKVRIDLILKGREKAHADLATAKINEFVATLNSTQPVTTIQPLLRQGGKFSLTISY